jgi:hypothetical protein
MCPKALSELKNAQRNVQRVGGKKIEFAKIVQAIQQSGKYWAVTEVHEQLVQKKIGRFRTLKLLNGSAATKKLDCVYDEGKFWFGPKLQQ